MKKRALCGILVTLLLVSTGSLWAAFERVPESPWLQAGPASALFPRTPLALISNPACIGLLGGNGVAASASRPFDLRELDRCAVAGSLLMSGRYAAGAALTLSGDGSYSESSLEVCCALRVATGVILGAGTAFRRLQISGYGTGNGFSANVGFACSPVPGIYATGGMRGVLRTDAGGSGDPVVPRGVEFALGVCPAEGVTVAAGIGREENLDSEISFSSSFSPDPMLSLGACMLTSPLRFSFCLSVSLSRIDLGYGYSGHETLPGTHSLSVCWGGCSSAPLPLQLNEPEAEQQETAFPIDINSATQLDLERIPGVGPAKASAIIAWINEYGPVGSISELIDVPGVGPSILETLRGYLTVE